VKPHLGFGVFQRIGAYAKLKTFRVSIEECVDYSVEHLFIGDLEAIV